MDFLDMQIIKHLEKEGRISHEELSKRLNLSRPAIHNRVAKLEVFQVSMQ
jgi:Lrp/AsnC family leucine-responsive transcriptional regulator